MGNHDVGAVSFHKTTSVPNSRAISPAPYTAAFVFSWQTWFQRLTMCSPPGGPDDNLDLYDYCLWDTWSHSSRSPLLGAEYPLGRDRLTMNWRMDWWRGPGLTFSLLSRMATLGVSFGLVACLLGLVLSLCFATEFSVSGSLNPVHLFSSLWPFPHQ